MLPKVPISDKKVMFRQCYVKAMLCLHRFTSCKESQEDHPNILLKIPTFQQFYRVMRCFSQKFLTMSVSCIKMRFSAFCTGVVHNLCTADVGEGGSGQALSYCFSLVKVNQNFHRKRYMWGRGGQKWPILALHNLWTAP